MALGKKTTPTSQQPQSSSGTTRSLYRKHVALLYREISRGGTNIKRAKKKGSGFQKLGVRRQIRLGKGDPLRRRKKGRPAYFPKKSSSRNKGRDREEKNDGNEEKGPYGFVSRVPQHVCAISTGLPTLCYNEYFLLFVSNRGLGSNMLNMAGRRGTGRTNRIRLTYLLTFLIYKKSPRKVYISRALQHLSHLYDRSYNWSLGTGKLTGPHELRKRDRKRKQKILCLAMKNEAVYSNQQAGLARIESR